MSDNDLDLLVPDDQGPSTEAAGAVHPDGHITREADHLAEDAPTQDGIAPGQALEGSTGGVATGGPTTAEVGADDVSSGDLHTPGEVAGQGNAAGLNQGIDD